MRKCRCAGRMLCRPCARKQRPHRPVHRHRIAHRLDRAEGDAPRRHRSRTCRADSYRPGPDPGSRRNPRGWRARHQPRHPAPVRRPRRRRKPRRRSARRTVGERTIESPLAHRGECMRQKGPIRLAVVPRSSLPGSDVVQQADQRRESERARRQHDLVVRRIRRLAGRGNDAADLLELELAQARFAHEGVQVPHGQREQLAKARVGGTAPLRPARRQ